MAFTPMADVPNPIFDANGNPFSGAVLKAFLPGTTTPTSMFINSDGDSPQAMITANAKGIWEVSGNAVVPHIDQECKWGIYADFDDATNTNNAPFYMGPFDHIEQPALAEDIVDLSNNTDPAKGSALIGHLIDGLTGVGSFPSQVSAELNRLSNRIIDVTDPRFGADNTGQTDATAGIRLAAQYVAANNGALYFPAGEYAISGGLLQEPGGGTLDWQWGMSILGDGRRTTRFIPFGAGTSDIIFDIDNSVSNFGFLTVGGFGFLDDVGTPLFTGDLISVGATGAFNGIDVTIDDFIASRSDAHALSLNNSFDCTLINFYLHSCGNTDDDKPSVQMTDCNNIRMYQMHIENFKDRAMILTDCNNISWFGGKTHKGTLSPNKAAVLFEGTDLSRVFGVTFSTSNNEHVLMIDGPTAKASNGNRLIGNTFGNTNNSASAVRLLDATDDTVISANVFTSDVDGNAADFASTGTNNKFGLDNISAVPIPVIEVPGFDAVGNLNIAADVALTHTAGSTLTISSGVVTATGNYHLIDTEASAATDDLDTITVVGEPRQLWFAAASSSRTIVFKDSTGNLRMPADFSADNAVDIISFFWNGAVLQHVASSDNGA